MVPESGVVMGSCPVVEFVMALVVIGASVVASVSKGLLVVVEKPSMLVASSVVVLLGSSVEFDSVLAGLSVDSVSPGVDMLPPCSVVRGPSVVAESGLVEGSSVTGVVLVVVEKPSVLSELGSVV